jgi:hypothetical protein
VFLLSGSNRLKYYECRGTKPDARQLLSPVTEVGYGLLVQCRGTKSNPRRLLSPVTNLISGRGGCPGLSPDLLLSSVQKPPQKP